VSAGPRPGGPTASAPAGGWRTAVVREVRHPTPRSVVLGLDVPDRVEQLAGQHYVVRLTADDGYVAQRSYSVASAPDDPRVELFVERLADGEVSGFLADGVAVGDTLEVRGPIGGWFVWDGTRPAVGVGGGSGAVPLVAMLRHARHLGHPERLHLAVAARTLADLPYADELVSSGALVALSREVAPSGRPPGRLTATELAGLAALVAQGQPGSQDEPGGPGGPAAAGGPPAAVFVCGSAPFAETVSTALVAAGIPAGTVRVERFGPSS